jgi:hypothetical protein
MSRRRYRFDEATQTMVEVGAEWTDASKRAQTTTEALVYGDLGRATDGTPIDSRTKHREYMERNGLTVASDYSGTWERAKAEREKVYTGQHDVKETREAVARALYHQTKRRK